MKRRMFMSVVAGALITFALAMPAQAATWDYLGQRQVKPFFDKDKIHVGVFRGPFKKIRLQVRGNDLYMYNLKVVYGNGAVDNIPVRFHFHQGSRTRVIDLRGGYRIIKEIRLTYGKLLNGRGRTVVRAWGGR